MKAYPIELRERVLSAYDSGQYSLNQISDQYQVTVRWIQKLRRQRDQEGDISPKPQNQGRKPAFSGDSLKALDEFVLSNPDATLEEIKEHFLGKIDCSIVAIHNALKKLGWRYKKNRYMQVSKTGKM